ncbi:HAD family hydrolase [Chloroflexota bacterium]
MPGKISSIFLDDGGVLNDNNLRGPEWLRLIGEFMPVRMGGTVDQWARANQKVFPEVWENIQARLPEFVSYRDFERSYILNWMGGMCAHVGVATPTEDDAEELYGELSVYVSEHADSAIAGAADAVLKLHSLGYTLYTASGTSSRELRGILGKMSIASVFSGLYGPDLIDRVKYGPAFYHSIFKDADIDPGNALVIDSDSECCQWASEAGADAIRVDPGGQGDVTSLHLLVKQLA